MEVCIYLFSIVLCIWFAVIYWKLEKYAFLVSLSMGITAIIYCKRVSDDLIIIISLWKNISDTANMTLFYQLVRYARRSF